MAQDKQRTIRKYEADRAEGQMKNTLNKIAERDAAYFKMPRICHMIHATNGKRGKNRKPVYEPHTHDVT